MRGVNPEGQCRGVNAEGLMHRVNPEGLIGAAWGSLIVLTVNGCVIKNDDGAVNSVPLRLQL